MDILTCKDFSICQGTAEALLSTQKVSDAKYHIAQVDFRNVDVIDRLKEVGYSFHDRVLGMEINILNNKKNRDLKWQGGGLKILIDFSENFTEEMFQMACKVFDTDRRFHLERSFNQSLANDVIWAYVSQYVDGGISIIQAVCQNNILGYTILKRIKDNCFENVLGVTKQGIAGKTAAIPLYLGTLDFIESQGGRKYIGMVSSTNIASLNLHMQLGAKVTGIYDKYILRKASKSINEPL